MTKNFNTLCKLLLEKKKPQKVQSEQREKWVKFIKRAGLNPKMYWYDDDNNEIVLCKPVHDK